MAAKQKPDIPKSLGGRIRAAQEKVRSARASIIYGGRAITQSSNRIADYESDPLGFADRFYRGHGWDSYPVQTTISRERERLAYNERRVPERITELAEAEANLEAVEEAVLLRVINMRDSKGRIPWPKAPPTLARIEQQAELDAAREEALYRARKARDDERYEREIAVANEKMRKSIGALVDSVEDWMNTLPEERREQVREAIRVNLERMRAKEISPFQFLAAFQS